MLDSKVAYSQFEAWLNDICASEQPDDDVIAYNFGLFEGENSYMVYLIGSKEYDEEDSDWACNEDFTPKQRYFELPDSVGDEWEHIQAEVESMVKQYITTPAYEGSFFAAAQAITVGFDDGDLSKVK